MAYIGKELYPCPHPTVTTGISDSISRIRFFSGRKKETLLKLDSIFPRYKSEKNLGKHKIFYDILFKDFCFIDFP